MSLNTKYKIQNIKPEQPIIYKIIDIIDEAEGIKTFKLKGSIDALPGQFVMAWIPRLNLKPFGISAQDENSFNITVSQRGNFTEELFKKKIGDSLGIQGPYGKIFSQDKNNVILVGGGYGAAPLAFLADELEKKGAKITLIIGARDKGCLIYEERFKNRNINLLCMTDDGSSGQKGFTTDALRKILSEDKEIEMVYTVGPEIMMQKIIDLTDEFNIPCEASLERYMKCGFGICGQCCVDGSGVRVCQEGPVFSKEFIKEHISEFGKYERDKTGNKIKH